MRIRITLQSKLISLFLLLSLLPLAFVAFIAYNNGQKALKKRIGLKWEKLAIHTIDQINGLLFIRKEDVKAWAATEIMQDVVADDPDGRIARTLVRLNKNYGVYSGIFCINSQGTIIASSKTENIGRDVSDKAWFKNVVRTKKAYTGDLQYDDLIRAFTVNFSAPIVASYDENRIVGVLCSHFYWGELFKLTDDIQVNKEGQTASGYAVTINKEGFAVTGPHFVLKERKEENILPSRNFLSLGYESARLAAQGRNGFLIETDFSDKEWLIGYAGSRGYQDFEGLGWAVLIMQETKEAFAPVIELRNQFVGICLMVAAIVFILAILVSRGITLPIRKLTAAAGAVAKGDLSQKVDVKLKDEIGALSDSFNQMTEELSKSRDELKNAKDFSENILNNMADGVDIVNENYAIQFMNKRFMDIFGKDAIGKKCYEVYKIDKKMCDLCPVKRRINIGETNAIEVSGIKGGKTFLISHTGMKNPDGSFAILEIFRDITELKKAEEGLRKLSSAVEQTADNVLITNKEGIVEYVNPAFEELTGYTKKEVVGKRPKILKSGKHGREFYDELWKVILSGKIFHSILVNRKKNGALYYSEKTIAPIRDRQGNITHFVSTDRDVTERKRADDRIHLLQTMTGAISESKDFNSSLGIALRMLCEATGWNFGEAWIPRSDESVLGCAPALYMSTERLMEFRLLSEKFTFLPNKGLPGRIWSSKQPEWARDVSIEKETSFLRSQIAKKAGLKAAFGVPISANDRVLAVLVFFMFEARKEDKQLVELVSTVAMQLGAVIQRKKAEGVLKDYVRRIAAVNKELDDFTYTISHDLKEPLRSIDAFSKFVERDYKDKLDEEGRNYLKRIRANAASLQNLIEDLLEISRIDRSKNPFEQVEAERIIDEAKFRLEYAIQEKDAEIIIRNKLPKVFCDRVKLTEVFLNLMSNAIKFTNKKKPLIEIGSRQIGHFYEFYVKDNGPGIEKEYFDKIFEIFQRLGRREEHEGTGAGLAIVKKIVQMHKGRIWLESKKGEGTIFYFTLPREKDFAGEKKRIGEILVSKKLITEEDVKKALDEQK